MLSTYATFVEGRRFFACCGKMICSGCAYAPVYEQGNALPDTCPFCRTPRASSNGEMIRRYEKRVEQNDSYAIYSVGGYYFAGQYGLPRNFAKALELWHRAGELGSARAYTYIGCAYNYGEGVEVDKKKAQHYYELAAMGGFAQARCHLGMIEVGAGNMDRALRYFMIATKDGEFNALKNVKSMYKHGYATKDDYMKALRSYQAYLDEIKSDQRDEAAAFSDGYKYYESSAV